MSKQSPNKISNIDEAIKRLANPHPDKKKSSQKGKKEIALVLSGGGASGAFEAGAIEETLAAVNRYNADNPGEEVSITAVLGTSTGALNSYGLLLNSMIEQNMIDPPSWLANTEGNSINARLWRYISRKNRAGKYVLDKPWLLRILNVFGKFRVILSLLALILCYAGTILGASWLARLFFPINSYSSNGLLTLAGAAIFTLLTIIILLLSGLMKNIIRRNGRPFLTMLCAVFIGVFIPQLGRNMFFHYLPPYMNKYWEIALYTLASIGVLSVSARFFWMVNGTSIFENSRLLRLLAMLLAKDVNTNSLTKAISRKKALSISDPQAETLWALVNANSKKLPTCVFTSSDSNAKRQGLVTLGTRSVAEKLAKKKWLVLYPQNSQKGTAQITPDKSLRGALASTAIPFTYPAEVMDFNIEDNKYQHTFIDGGALNFVPFHAAIDMGYTRILSIETDSMTDNNMEKITKSTWVNFLTNLYSTIFTSLDGKAREDAKRVAYTNKLLLEAKCKIPKDFIRLIRIAPSLDERMINSEEFDGRYVNGKLKHSLDDWINYGRNVNPGVAPLPSTIWYKTPNDEWAEKTTIYGPLIWDASLQAAPAKEPS